MKFLFTLIFTIVGFISFSQVKILKCYSVCTAKWNGNEWVFGEKKQSIFNFKFENNIITVGDSAHSIYYTNKQIYNTGIVTRWDAIDEEKRNCIFGMQFYDDYIVLMVTYYKQSYIYFCHIN